MGLTVEIVVWVVMSGDWVDMVDMMLEVKLESSLTVGVVVASEGWVVMSGDWFEGVVIGMVESDLVEPDWVESELVDSDWDESDLVVSGLVVSGD